MHLKCKMYSVDIEIEMRLLENLFQVRNICSVDATLNK